MGKPRGKYTKKFKEDWTYPDLVDTKFSRFLG
jgi:hypothetical protein